MTNPAAARLTPLTPNQIRGFIAAWGGWALDGMDSFIYSLVLVPALTELLPQSGIEATAGNVGFYGSVLFALFLIGWGLSMLWGPIADRFGRVRTLTLTILCYSLFTLLCGLAAKPVATRGAPAAGRHRHRRRMVHRRDVRRRGMAGGSPKERRRPTCTPATTSASSWPRWPTTTSARKYGWRWMFVVGGTPALLVTFIRYGVRESATWRERIAEKRRPAMTEAFAKIFSSAYARRTLLNSLYLLVSIVGLWAGSVYVPTSVREIALREGRTVAERDAARVVRHDDPVDRHHSRLSGPAAAGGIARAAAHAGLVLPA